MVRLTEAVRSSLRERNWYSALALALSLPDICGGIEYPAEPKPGLRYATWFESYLGAEYTRTVAGRTVTFLSGGDCYALRCAFLHNGGGDITEHRARETLSKIHFTTMNAHRVRAQGETLTLNVRVFCEEVCTAVEAWLANRAADPRVRAEVDALLVVHHEGFFPHPTVDMHVAPDPLCLPPEDAANGGK